MTSSSTVVYIVEGIFASLILLIPIIFYYHFRNNDYHKIKSSSGNTLYKDRYYRNLLAIMLVLFLANGIFLFVYSFQEEYRLAN